MEELNSKEILQSIIELRETIKQSQKETGRQIDENRKSIRDLREENRLGIEELREANKQGIEELREENRKGMEKLREELKKENHITAMMLKATDKKLNNFIGNYGSIAEEYFYRSLEQKMSLGNIKFDRIERNIKENYHSCEFDIILFNGDSIGIIEVKSRARYDKIKEIINSKITNFKRDFEDYKNYKIYFGIASMVTNKNLVDTAKENGIFLLTQKGDHLELLNEEVRAF